MKFTKKFIVGLIALVGTACIITGCIGLISINQARRGQTSTITLEAAKSLVVAALRTEHNGDNREVLAAMRAVAMDERDDYQCPNTRQTYQQQYLGRLRCDSSDHVDTFWLQNTEDQRFTEEIYGNVATGLFARHNDGSVEKSEWQNLYRAETAFGDDFFTQVYFHDVTKITYQNACKLKLRFLPVDYWAALEGVSTAAYSEQLLSLADKLPAGADDSRRAFQTAYQKVLRQVCEMTLEICDGKLMSVAYALPSVTCGKGLLTDYQYDVICGQHTVQLTRIDAAEIVQPDWVTVNL